MESILHVELILTVSTFLFAILAGFFIARLNSRYDKIISYISDEDSYWLSFYRSSLIFGKKFADKVSDIIDEYYRIAFSGEVGNYYYIDNIPVLEKAYREMRGVKLPDSHKSQVTFQNMLNYLTDIERTRNQSSVLTREKLTGGQWTVLVLLSAIIISCMFLLGLPPIYFEIITVLLSTILVLVLLIIRDLQNLKLGGYALSIESGQEVFELVGKLRYYPEILIKDGSIQIPNSVKKYRLGVRGKDDKYIVKIINRQKGARP